MTGYYHEPVVRRNFLLVLKVLKLAVPDAGADRQPSTQMRSSRVEIECLEGQQKRTFASRKIVGIEGQREPATPISRMDSREVGGYSF